MNNKIKNRKENFLSLWKAQKHRSPYLSKQTEIERNNKNKNQGKNIANLLGYKATKVKLTKYLVLTKLTR